MKGMLITLLVVLNVYYVSAQNKKIEIGVIFNPTYASRLLTSSDSNFKDYAEILNDSEGPMFAFDAGVQITVLKKTHLELVTGLLYSKQGFHLSNPDVGIQYPIGTIDAKSICDFLQIPIRINYRIREGSRSYLIVGITNDFLLNSRIEGYYPEYNTFVEANRTYNIGLDVGFGYDFKLSDKVILALEPNLKYQLMHSRTEDVPGKRHFYTLGLTFNTKFNL